MQINSKDLTAGLIFTGIGLVVGAHSLLTLDPGSVQRMGPGFFPIALAVVLGMIGVAITLSALGTAGSRRQPVPWRALVLILTASVVFGLTIRGAGFLPATLLTILMAMLAEPMRRPLKTLLSAVLLTAFCHLVFVIGLGITARPFGPWFGI